MPRNAKTWIIILALLSAAPVAVILANSLADRAALPTNGGTVVDDLPPGTTGGPAQPTVTAPRQAPFACRVAEGLRVASSGIELDPNCCNAAVIGEVENTCNRPLVGEVDAAFRDTRGAILAVGNSTAFIDRLEGGERRTFRIDFSSRVGWELAQTRGVRPRFIIRSTVVP